MRLDPGLADKLKGRIAAATASGMKLDRAVIKVAQDFAPTPESRRMIDGNGWFEVRRNPLSKVGIFPYLGRSISTELDPDTMYMVYRPEEELNNSETINSFKLIPWIDDHEMLGPGYTPAEDKGIHGIVGEDVFFEDGYLYGNIKCFSQGMDDLINSGSKKELSAGYRCWYEISSGIFEGQRYDAVQRGIRGNHLALVTEGRMGPDVAVMDHYNFTFDAKDVQMTTAASQAGKTVKAGKDEGEAGAEPKVMSPAELTSALQSLMPLMDVMNEIKEKLNAGGAPAPGDAGAGMVIGDETEEEKTEREKKEKKDGEDKASMDARFKASMDAADKRISAMSGELESLKKNSLKTMLGEIAQRDDLINRLSPFIGAFDAKEKTLAEVAAYGVEKLGLKPAAGSEIAALDGFLHGRQPQMAQPGFVLALDSGAASDGDKAINAYLSGKAA